MNESFLENFPKFEAGDEVFCLKTGIVFIIQSFEQQWDSALTKVRVKFPKDPIGNPANIPVTRIKELEYIRPSKENNPNFTTFVDFVKDLLIDYEILSEVGDRLDHYNDSEELRTTFYNRGEDYEIQVRITFARFIVLIKRNNVEIRNFVVDFPYDPELYYEEEYHTLAMAHLKNNIKSCFKG